MNLNTSIAGNRQCGRYFGNIEALLTSEEGGEKNPTTTISCQIKQRTKVLTLSNNAHVSSKEMEVLRSIQSDYLRIWDLVALGHLLNALHSGLFYQNCCIIKVL